VKTLGKVLGATDTRSEALGVVLGARDTTDARS